MNTWGRRIVTGIVAGTFLIAAGAKLLSPMPLANAIAFLLPPLADHRQILFALPGVVAGWEAALALILLTGQFRRTVFIVTLATLAAFTLLLITLLLRPDSPPCGCFGSPLGWAPAFEHLIGITRNLGLIAFVVFLLNSNKDPNNEVPAGLETTSERVLSH